MRCLAGFLLLLVPNLAFGQTPGQMPRTLPGATECAVDLPEPGPNGGWTPAEKYAWQRLCLTGRVDMRGAGGDTSQNRILSPVFLETILTRQDLAYALTDPIIWISNSIIYGNVDFNFRKIHTAFVLENSKITGNIEMVESKFLGSFFIKKTNIYGGIFADRSMINGGLFISDSNMGIHKQNGSIRFLGSNIKGNLELNGSRFYAKLIADGAIIGGDIFLQNGSIFKKKFRLLGAQILGDFDASSSNFIEKTIFMEAIHLDRLEVKGNIFLRGGTSFKDINLLGARVGGDLQLGRSIFDGNLDMTGAKIEGELLLSSPRHGTPEWGDDAKLILRNVSVEALQAEPLAWLREDETWVPTELTGFTYNRLGGLNAHESDTMADEAAEWLIGWIENQENHAERYDPHPYEQLSQALERAGAVDKAKEVRFAKLEHKREAANTDPQTVKLLWWSKWLLGHGVYPFRVLYWFGGLVLLGAVVALFSRDPVIGQPPNPIWYSLENSLPLVELAERYKNPNHDRLFFNSFFHLQKVLGFGLATILVGALTLLGTD